MDFLKILELLPKLLDAFKEFIHSPSDLKSKIVAYLLVPCAAGVIAYFAVGRPETLFGKENAISIVRVSSRFDAGRVSKQDGMALLIEPSELECKVPLPHASSQRLTSSLLPEEWEHNVDRLGIEGTDIHLKLPLWGISRPIVVLAEGEAPSELWISGAKLAVSNLELTAQRSVNLVTWGFVSAVFGLGLGFASEPPTAVKNGGGKE